MARSQRRRHRSTEHMKPFSRCTYLLFHLKRKATELLYKHEENGKRKVHLKYIQYTIFTSYLYMEVKLLWANMLHIS